MSNKKPLVFIPTYNERDNVENLVTQIQGLALDLDILIVDDNSPDGTGEIIDALAKRYPNVSVSHRSGKLGIGSAHRDGIRWAYEHGYAQLVTMDCDFTHPPDRIPELLEAAEKTGADVVVGSRYLKDNSLAGWNPMRLFLTYTGHFLTKVLLGMTHDATGGFRLYHLQQIPEGLFDLVSSKGYSFFFESLYVIQINGFKISEIPIELPPRTYGHSKMDFSEVKRSLALLASLYATTSLSREKLLLGEELPSDQLDPTALDEQGWDEYWTNHVQGGKVLYDVIAAMYRRIIIRQNLNYFVRKYFQPGAEILHAGCGGGQVDIDVSKYVSVTGLDISPNALRLYKKLNPNNAVVHGSIFNMPLADGSVDGIYNLGVMEHFTEVEIANILREFHRVLKPQGRLIIFWPPEFGSSVVFLKGVKWFIDSVLGKKGVKLHPDEITRVQSKAHVVDLFKQAGFSTHAYYFGMRDAFTYSVIVCDRQG